MKTRIIKIPDGRFKVQMKGWFFWHTHSKSEMAYDAGVYKVHYVYDTLQKAEIALINLIKRHNDKIQGKKDSGVVLEIDSEDLEKKFAEHFI